MKSFFAGKRYDSKQTSMQSTHMQAHTDSNKANNETSTDQHADRCMQTLTECTALHSAAVRDRDRSYRSSGAQYRRVIYSIDARPVASHSIMIGRPHTQTLDYHCRHSMAIPGDGYRLLFARVFTFRVTSCFVKGPGPVFEVFRKLSGTAK